MTTETKSLVGALQDGLQLFRLLAADFAPRTHRQIVDLATARGLQWSPTKIHNMLQTLEAENFMRQDDAGAWTISPHITAIAVAYHESISRRSQALLQDVAELKQLTHERMK